MPSESSKKGPRRAPLIAASVVAGVLSVGYLMHKGLEIIQEVRDRIAEVANVFDGLTTEPDAAVTEETPKSSTPIPSTAAVVPAAGKNSAHAAQAAVGGQPPTDEMRQLGERASKGDIEAAKKIAEQFSARMVKNPTIDTEENFCRELGITSTELHTMRVATGIRKTLDTIQQAPAPYDHEWGITIDPVERAYVNLYFAFQRQMALGGQPFDPNFLDLIGVDKSGLQDIVREAIEASKTVDSFADRAREFMKQTYEIE